MPRTTTHIAAPGILLGATPLWLRAMQSGAAFPPPAASETLPPATVPGGAQGIGVAPWILVGAVALIAVLTFAWLVVRRRRKMKLLLGAYDPPPLLFGGPSRTRPSVRPHLPWQTEPPIEPVAPVAPVEPTERTRAPSSAADAAPRERRAAQGSRRAAASARGTTRAARQSGSASDPHAAADGGAARAASHPQASDMVDADADTKQLRRVAAGGGTVVAAPAAEMARDVPSPWPARTMAEVAAGTLQLLPGKLEVEAGEDPGQEIRFVRPVGGIADITLGRADGPAYTHVQFRSATVSRHHARLRYEGRRWLVANLSETNPLLVNGRAVPADSGVHILQDGDRIEMGEVILRFRER